MVREFGLIVRNVIGRLRILILMSALYHFRRVR